MEETKKYLKIIILVFLIIWTASSIYSAIRPLPRNLNLEGNIYNVSEENIEFLYDLTYFDLEGNKIHQQEIFSKVFEIINNSQKQILIDMFLFNNDYDGEEYLEITTQLKDNLIEKKRENPEMKIVFISDEINNFYGSYVSDEIKELKEEGIEVVITDLRKLRDVNFLYAGFWRSYLQWFGTRGDGWIVHPLGNSEKKVTLRSIFKLMNTKANHRKLIVADSEEGLISLVTSANPHKASSLHSNVAFLVRGNIGNDIIESELAIARFSGKNIELEKIYSLETGPIQVQFLTERKIRDELISLIDSLGKNDSVDIAMFYLSDRKVIDSIIEASKRDVEIRLVLDPNKDAFAMEKNGIPNRQVAYELVRKSNGKIQIRWYKTQGEQFHSKMIIIKKDGKLIVLIGSANLTKRNIGLYNLEANLKITLPSNTETSLKIQDWYDMIWNNRNGIYSIDFEEYREKSYSKYLLYRFQEASGFSSF